MRHKEFQTNTLHNMMSYVNKLVFIHGNLHTAKKVFLTYSGEIYVQVEDNKIYNLKNCDFVQVTAE